MGRPKAGIRLTNGFTMIEQVYRAMKNVCEKIVLVGHGDGVPDSINHLRRIEDHYQNCGPLGGLQALLNSGLDSEYLVAPCDLCCVSPAVFTFLAAQNSVLPIVLKSKHGLQPLLGRYPSQILPVVTKQILDERLAMSDLIFAVPATIVQIPEAYEDSIFNANIEKDLMFQN